MFIKTLFLLVLSILAFAKPQTDEETAEALKNLDVSTLDNRIEFIQFTPHQETNLKEGDIITINIDPPTPENAAAAADLVKSFTVAIGTGSGFAVDDVFFMESERFVGLPTSHITYKFQLPAQMEDKDYCIVYTPYATEDGFDKPYVGDVPMESLYETWFHINGSLEVGTGPQTAENTIANDVSITPAANAGVAVDNTNAQVQNTADGAAAAGQAVDAAATTATDANATSERSGSITIAPAFTAFIAVLFACFFI